MNNFKYTLIRIALTMVSAIVLVVGLAWKTVEEMRKPTNFNRTFNKTHLSQEGVMVNDGITGLSGYTEHSLFFQTKNPSILLVTDYKLTPIDTIDLHIPIAEQIATVFSTYVDSPYVTLLAGRLSTAFEFNLSDKNATAFMFPTTLFTRGLKIGPHSYVIRGVDTLVKRFDQIFIKANSITGDILKEDNISETNKDAGLSTDGMLSFNRQKGLIFYTEYYSKNVLCLDTNLQLKYRASTIDNTRSVPITAAINKNVLTADTPKRLINGYTDSFGEYFFTNSAIKADNETTETRVHNSALDLYKVSSGQYQETIYVPSYNNERITRFRVVGNHFLGFYKKHIVSYRFPLE